MGTVMVSLTQTRRDAQMKVYNAHEYIGKEVYDANGTAVGVIDKVWNSWNAEYPGYFFGIRPNDNARDTWFRGTYKLVPIYNDYIRDTNNDHVTLNKTVEELGKFWNKAVPCGTTTCPTDEMIEKAIYDKNHSRVGTFFAWVENDGTYRNYGCFVDPYLAEKWHVPTNMMMPLPTNYVFKVTDTVTLDRTIDELRDYWKQNGNWNW